MFILFSDDSGNHKSKWKVFSGVCLSEIEAFKLKQFLSEQKLKYGIDPTEEIKPLLRDYKSVQLTKEQAEELTFSMYDYISSISNLVMYGVFFHNKYLKSKFTFKGKIDYPAIQEYQYTESAKCLYDKFDRLLSSPYYPYTNDPTEIPKYGLIIIDEPSNKISADILSKIRKMTAEGTKYRPSNLILWGVSYTSSNSNFGIEIAGFVAFALRKAIDEDNLAFIDKCKTKINRTNDGTINNWGVTFFDGTRGRHRMTTKQRVEVLKEKNVGEKFRNLIYTEAINI